VFYSTGSERNLIAQHAVRDDDLVVVHSQRRVVVRSKAGGPLSDLPQMGRSPDGLVIDGNFAYGRQVQEPVTNPRP